MEDTMLLQTDERRPVSQQNTVPFSFLLSLPLCLSHYLPLPLPLSLLESHREALAEHDSLSSIYSQAVSSSS